MPMPHPESFRTIKANGSRVYLLRNFQWTEEQYDEGSDYGEQRFQEAANRSEKTLNVYAIDHMSEGPAQDLMNDIYKDFLTAKPDLNRHVPGSSATWENNAIHLLARLVRDKKRRQMKIKVSRDQPDVSDFDREQKIQKGDLDFEALKTLLRVEGNLQNDTDEIWFNGKHLVEERNWQMAIKGAYDEESPSFLKNRSLPMRLYPNLLHPLQCYLFSSSQEHLR